MDMSSDTLTPAGVVSRRYGRSVRTIDRWLDDDELGFPRPVVIRGRRYWRESDLVEWERKQAANASARAA